MRLPENRPVSFPPAGYERWLLAVALAVTLLVAYYNRLTVSFAIPLLEQEYGWSTAQTATYGSLLMGLFYLGFGLSNIFLTPYALRYGPRRVLVAMVLLWALATSSGALASTALVLFMASRVALGVTEGVHIPTLNQLTKNWFPMHERSRANSLWISGIYLAVLSSPLLLVPLMHRYGWRDGFHALAALSLLLSLPFILRYVYDRPSEHPRVSAAEASYIEHHASREGEIQAGEAGVSMRALLARPVFVLMLVAGILNNMIALGLSGWLPTYLAARSGVRFEDLTYLAALPYAASFIGLVTWSVLGDRTGSRASLAALGYLFAGIVIIAGLEVASVWATIGCFAFGTFFIAAFNSAEFALVQRMLPIGQVAVGAGIYNGVTTLIGGGLGPLAVRGLVSDPQSLGTYASILLPCLALIVTLVVVGRRLKY
jgi:sugar phosphate permease